MRDTCRGRVGQVIFVRTIDVYGYPLHRIPQAERDPRVPTITDYAEQKKQCESLLEEAAADGTFVLTIARPSIDRRFRSGFQDCQIDENSPVNAGLVDGVYADAARALKDDLEGFED